jgi:hypothetical protein
MTHLEMIGLLASRNLGIGNWTNQKGEKHVSLTRMGKYNKNIAIPVDMVDVVCEALQAEKAKIEA